MRTIHFLWLIAALAVAPLQANAAVLSGSTCSAIIFAGDETSGEDDVVVVVVEEEEDEPDCD